MRASTFTGSSSFVSAQIEGGAVLTMRLISQTERGSGALVWDESGREYIDLGSGIGVNAFGAADPVWADAVSAQAHALQGHTVLAQAAQCGE